MSKMQGTLIQINDDGSMTVYLCKKYNTFADILLDKNPPQYALCVDTGVYYKRNDNGTWPEACIPSTYSFVEGVDYRSLLMTKGILSDNMRIVLTSDASVLEEENTIGWLSEDWVASNIAEGKSIFGKVGTLTINAGIDTSDATATAADILLGKTAYINGIKVTGEHICDSQNNPEGDDTGTSTSKGLTVSGIVGTPIATLTEAFASAEGDYQVTDESTTGHERVWTLTNNGYTFYFKWSETVLSWVLTECQDDPAMAGFPYIYAVTVGDDPWTSSDWKYSLLGVVQESVTVTQTSGSSNPGDSGESDGSDKVYAYTVTFPSCSAAEGDYWENGDGEYEQKNYINAQGSTLKYNEEIVPGYWEIRLSNNSIVAQKFGTGDAPDVGSWNSFDSDNFPGPITVVKYSGDDSGDSDQSSLDDFADRKYNGFELVSDEYGTQVFNETSQVLNGMIVYECLYNGGYYYCVMNDDRSAIIIAYYGTSSIAGNVSVGLLMNPDWQVYTADYPDGLTYPWDAFVSDYSPGTSGATVNTPLEMNPFSGTYNGGGNNDSSDELTARYYVEDNTNAYSGYYVDYADNQFVKQPKEKSNDYDRYLFKMTSGRWAFSTNIDNLSDETDGQILYTSTVTSSDTPDNLSYTYSMGAKLNGMAGNVDVNVYGNSGTGYDSCIDIDSFLSKQTDSQGVKVSVYTYAADNTKVAILDIDATHGGIQWPTDGAVQWNDALIPGKRLVYNPNMADVLSTQGHKWCIFDDSGSLVAYCDNKDPRVGTWTNAAGNTQCVLIRFSN